MFPEIFAEMSIPELDGMAEHLEDEMEMALERATGRTEGIAKQLAPVDTSALRNSIYTLLFGGKGSLYLNIRAAEVAASAKGNVLRLAGLPQLPADKFESVVAAGAEYAIYVEYGHMSRRSKMVARRRKGKIKVRVKDGETPHYDAGYYTYTPGTFFMTSATEDAFKRILPQEGNLAVKKAKERGKK